MRQLLMGFAAFVAVFTVAGPAAAVQSPIFETDYGVGVLSGDDATLSGNLPFAFSLFGHAYTSYEVSTNGFISFGGSNGDGCCNGAVGAFSAGAARVAPEWFDLVGQVFVNTSVTGRVVFTFAGSEFGYGGAYVAQAQLFDTGQIIFGYDSASVPLHTTLTGITSGHGALGAGSDLSNANFTTTVHETHELFDPGTFDLNGRNVIFTPNGEFAYDVSNSLPLSAAPEPGTWGLLLLGFAGIGVAIRQRRCSVAA